MSKQSVFINFELLSLFNRSIIFNDFTKFPGKKAAIKSFTRLKPMTLLKALLIMSAYL